MKKIYSLLAIFLCVGLIAPVCAFPIEKTHMDSWGRTMMFNDGDAIYFGQTVAVTNSSICYNYEYEVFENCTVTIKTNGHVVVVDENGEPIISKNGFEFRYTSNWRCIMSGMTWNNFPHYGREFSNFEVMDFETEGEAGMFMGVSTIKGAHSPDEYMIVQKGTWTSKDVKAHAEEKGVEYVYVLQFSRTGSEPPVKHVEVVDKDFVQSVLNSVCNGINYTQFPETITYGDMTFSSSLWQDIGREGYMYDYYWATSKSWTPYINILGAGPVKPYDSFLDGAICSESLGELNDFSTFDEFMSALRTIDDAYEVWFECEDSDNSNNNFAIDIALHG